MDAFKLLIRSTNIQKTGPVSRKGPAAPTPSAGAPARTQNPLDNDDFLHMRETSECKGTKRKRCGQTRTEVDGVSGELDFFGDRARLSVLSEHTKKAKRDVPKSEQARIQKSEGFEEEVPEFDEVECRQILKRHKVKITILGQTCQVQQHHNNDSTRTGPQKRGGKKDMHTQIWPQPLTSFQQLRSRYGISRRLAANLDAQGYAEPTEVQLGSLPLLLGSDDDRGWRRKGARKSKSKKHPRPEVDLITIAPTGSGKTLGFMIHVLQGLLKERQATKKSVPEGMTKHQVQALIIAPTHELADQIVNEGKKMAAGTGIKILGLKKNMRLHPELAIVSEQVSGGTRDRSAHTNETLVNSDILVSTPLLLLHAISAKEFTPAPLPAIRFLVLDEADVLLDHLFREQTLAIWRACSNTSLRTSLWSATIGSSIESLAHSFILDRRRDLGLHLSPQLPPHHVIRLVVGLKDSAIPNISHRLIYAASEQGKLLALRQLLHPSTAPTTGAPSLQPPFLIFTQTISRAIALHSELLYDIPVEAGGSSRIAVLHSDLSDTARSKIMAGFRNGEIWILITTDLLSRGMDFRGMNGVLNYDIPNTGASYVHRVGRTGRQGREGGVAVTLYTKEDVPYVKNVANVISASERAKANQGREGEGGGEGVQKWLLEALPDVSKKTKKALKSRGVESRSVTVEHEGGREARRMRISTKSGYDRRLENKKKGAVGGSGRRRKQRDSDKADEDKAGSEWSGIDD
ncbi:hypothetical protein N7G274_007879 [Stereocaulon virgatum]|uniref:RNA helicase n=1 Tax=Stereocaulon virgatum TaxID=373712 RepID=A0ABR4A2P7_9LECA